MLVRGLYIPLEVSSASVKTGNAASHGIPSLGTADAPAVRTAVRPAKASIVASTRRSRSDGRSRCPRRTRWICGLRTAGATRSASLVRSPFVATLPARAASAVPQPFRTERADPFPLAGADPFPLAGADPFPLAGADPFRE